MCSDILSRQVSTYMYILMNHWIATNMTGSCCLKTCRACSKSHHLYITCSKYPPPARTKISDVDELKGCIKNEWEDLNHAVKTCCLRRSHIVCTRLCFCWRQISRAYDVKMMWITTFFSIFETTIASRVCDKCICKYRVLGSICHFEFPKVVLAHISGEVCNLHIVLLNVTS